MKRFSPSYCCCGHSITFHALFADVGRDNTAPATCVKCTCTLFEYDAQLTRNMDRDAKERELAFREDK